MVSMLRDLADRSRSSTRRPSDAPEAALLARVAAGEVAAFEQLYRSYHPRLGRFLALMTARRAIVEEALNDTMMVVWRRAATYNHACKVSTWIFAIAYRVALKALREQDEAVGPADADALPSADDDPERRHRERQTRAALGRALAALSAEQRSVVVLTYFHDLPYAEIAAIVDCPVDTVKTRMFHARRRLKLLLAGRVEGWL